MLSLKINDRNVDLPNDFSFTMNLKSPMFGDVGSYSYPFKIPATFRNRINLGFPHRAAGTTNPFIDLPGVFEWKGIPLFYGNARLRTIGQNAYEGTVFEGNGDFYFQQKSKKLQQIDLGELTFANETAGLNYLKSTIDGYYPDYPLSCPVFKVPDYFDPATQVNEMKYFNYQYAGDIFRLTTLDYSERTLLVPMLYLRYVLERIFLDLDYQLIDDFFSSDAAYSRLVLVNATCCNNPASGPPERIPQGYTLDHIIFNYHVPRVPLIDFLKGLCNYLGIAFFVDTIGRTVRIKSMKSVLENEDYVDFSAGVIGLTKELEDKAKGYLLGIQTEDSFMDTLKDGDDELIELYGGSVKTYADLPAWPFAEIGSVWLTEDTGDFYQMTASKTWTASGFAMWTQWMMRDGSEKIETSFSTVYGFEFDGYGQLGSRIAEYRSIIPRLAFVKNHPSGTAGPTPHCTINGHSLLYSADSSYTKIPDLWKDFLQFRLDAVTVKIQRLMSFSDIKNFDFSRKIMVNGRKYLVKSLQVTLKKDRIMPATLECYECE